MTYTNQQSNCLQITRTAFSLSIVLTMIMIASSCTIFKIKATERIEIGSIEKKDKLPDVSKNLNYRLEPRLRLQSTGLTFTVSGFMIEEQVQSRLYTIKYKQDYSIDDERVYMLWGLADTPWVGEGKTISKSQMWLGYTVSNVISILGIPTMIADIATLPIRTMSEQIEEDQWRSTVTSKNQESINSSAWLLCLDEQCFPKAQDNTVTIPWALLITNAESSLTLMHNGKKIALGGETIDVAIQVKSSEAANPQKSIYPKGSRPKSITLNKKLTDSLKLYVDEASKKYIQQTYPFAQSQIQSRLVFEDGVKSYQLFQLFRWPIFGKNPETGSKFFIHLEQDRDLRRLRIGKKGEETEAAIITLRPYKDRLVIVSMEKDGIRNPPNWEWAAISLFNMISAHPDLTQIDETMIRKFTPSAPSSTP